MSLIESNHNELTALIGVDDKPFEHSFALFIQQLSIFHVKTNNSSSDKASQTEQRAHKFNQKLKIFRETQEAHKTNEMRKLSEQGSTTEAFP